MNVVLPTLTQACDHFRQRTCTICWLRFSEYLLPTTQAKCSGRTLPNWPDRFGHIH